MRVRPNPLGDCLVLAASAISVAEFRSFRNSGRGFLRNPGEAARVIAAFAAPRPGPMTAARRHLASSLFAALAALALSGCESALMDPKGDIGMQQRGVIISAMLWMALVVVPVFAMTAWFAWWFRAGNRRARYTPDWHDSPKLEAVVWGVPAAVVLAMGIGSWQMAHKLDPFRPIAAERPPVAVEVVALDWKWLFIYPEEGVAAVNELALPVGVPVAFRITSGSVMNSFFIPRLGSQVYAMSGMETRLHLIADAAGDYPGMSAQFSGRGFSQMRFRARAMSRRDYEAWLARARAAPAVLDDRTFSALLEPSESHPVTLYSRVEPGLFDALVAKFRTGHGP